MCFALVDTLDDDFEYKQLFVTTTIFVHFFTVFAMVIGLENNLSAIGVLCK